MKNIIKDAGQHRLGLAAIAMAALLWSTGGLFIKLLPFNPFVIIGYRSLFAAILLAIIFKKSAFNMSWLTFGVAVSYAGAMVTFVVANKMTTAANAIFLQYTGPVYVLLLEPLLFRTPLKRVNVWTVVACLAGMIFFFNGEFDFSGFWGNILAIISGVFLAAEILLLRLNKPEYFNASMFWANVIALLVGLPFMVSSPLPGQTEWGILAFLGLVQIGLASMFFTYGMKRATAIEGALLSMLEPVLNPVWVLLGYGERPGLYAMLGGLIIIVSLSIRVVVVEAQKRRMRRARVGV